MAARVPLLVGILLLMVACRDRGEAPSSIRQALGPSDAAVDAHPLCGKLGYAGCCASGQKLVYCVGGSPLEKSCAPASCGWDPAVGLYGCGSSNAADPSGTLPRACPGSGDAGSPLDLPQPDAPGDAKKLEGGSPCGPLGYAGCCGGSKLLYCVAGSVLHLECGAAAACGWNPQSLVYDCGTAGAADPSGVHPRLCATLFGDGGLQLDGPPDLGKDQSTADQSSPASDLAPPDLTAAGERGVADLGPRRELGEREARGRELSSGLDPSGLDRSGDRPATVSVISGGGGCSCELGSARNSPDLALVLSIGGLALLAWRRRSGSGRKV